MAPDGPKLAQDRRRWPEIAEDEPKIAKDGNTIGLRPPIERTDSKNHNKMTVWGLEGFPKWPQDGPMMIPRWPQDGPKMAQDGPKMAQYAPRSAPRRPKMSQDGPKMAEDRAS